MASRSNLGGQGGVEVKISGDTTQLESDVAAAKAKVEAATAASATGAVSGKAAAEVAAVSTAATQSSEAVKGLNKSLGDSVGQVQSLLGKLAMVVGTATGMYALGQAIRESVVAALETGTERAEKFRESVDFTNPKQSLADYDKKLAEVNEKLEKATREAELLASADYLAAAGSRGSIASVLANGYGTALDNVKKLKEEQAKLVADSQVTRDFINAQAEAEATRREGIAQKAREDAWEDENIRRIAVAQNAANEKRDKDIQAEVEAHDKRMEMLAEYRNKAEEAAEKTRQSWVDAFTQIRNASNEVFGSNRAMGDVGVASALTSMNTRSGASNRITFDGGN